MINSPLGLFLQIMAERNIKEIIEGHPTRLGSDRIKVLSPHYRTGHNSYVQMAEVVIQNGHIVTPFKQGIRGVYENPNRRTLTIAYQGEDGQDYFATFGVGKIVATIGYLPKRGLPPQD